MKWLIVLGLMLVSGVGGYFAHQSIFSDDAPFPLPLVSQQTPSPKPLQAYAIEELAQRRFQASQITLDSLVEETPAYSSYMFSFQTLGRTMTGLINLPSDISTQASPSAIVMIRGFVSPEMYRPGMGTKNAAAAFATHGYITIAPDFFGYGGSDPEPTDTWQARFEKPVAVIELIRTLQSQPIKIPDLSSSPAPTQIESVYLPPISSLGIWGHSNGGQIALTTLEIIGEAIPTTLWAPVTAPFPYSILFFSDEYDDEGKSMRQAVSQFETVYDVFDFSLTRHIARLRGPIQLHHGTADEAALIAWSDSFAQLIETENENRLQQATPSAEIDLTYFRYPGADHNLQPAWTTAIQRDLDFFSNQL